MAEQTVTRVIIRTYEGDGQAEERTSFAVTEAADGEVDLIIHPFTTDARTISLDAEQAWRLARELARAASAVERPEET